jgi:hypothetical protein
MVEKPIEGQNMAIFLQSEPMRGGLEWCYAPLQHDFALDPIITPFDIHFRIYKRDLAILTE